MATFKPVVRSNKELNLVYIRISTRQTHAYIKTSMLLDKSGIKEGEISDYTILANCWNKIKIYNDKLKNINTDLWKAPEIKKFLLQDNEKVSFTDFAEKFISSMINEGRDRPAANYKTALNSLKIHLGKDKFFFSDITSHEIRRWIKSLSGTKRAKQLYPVSIKKIFDDGCLEYNDYDRNIIRIQNQPFKAIKIPMSDVPDKRSVETEVIRNILLIKPETKREQLAHDVVLLIICLAGINTVDLYKIEKQELLNNKLIYNRSKTEAKRRDKSYFEITISDKIRQLFEKYQGKKNLFIFRERYSTSDTFLTAVNKGLKSLCKRGKLQKITTYWLRHTWATVAQNECGASTELVAFCLNHSSAHRVTESYIKKDFSPVDKINQEVIEKIFPNSQNSNLYFNPNECSLVGI